MWAEACRGGPRGFLSVVVGMLVSFFLKCYLFIILAFTLGLMGHAGHLVFVVASSITQLQHVGLVL